MPLHLAENGTTDHKLLNICICLVSNRNKRHVRLNEKRDPKGRTIRKVMGGGGRGKNQKKIHARENVKKKNSCKEEGKEKKFVQKEGPTPGPAI